MDIYRLCIDRDKSKEEIEQFYDFISLYNGQPGLDLVAEGIKEGTNEHYNIIGNYVFSFPFDDKEHLQALVFYDDDMGNYLFSLLYEQSKRGLVWLDDEKNSVKF